VEGLPAPVRVGAHRGYQPAGIPSTSRPDAPPDRSRERASCRFARKELGFLFTLRRAADLVDRNPEVDRSSRWYWRTHAMGAATSMELH